MGNRNGNRSESNPDQKPKPANNHYINKIHIGLTDLAFGLTAPILLGLGGILATDAQYRWPGVFFFVGGVALAAFGIFLHARHRVFNKRNAAVKTMVAFSVVCTFFVTLGSSQWWFNATRDAEIFNTLIVNDFFTLPAPNGTPPFNAAAFLPNNEIVLHPINHLLYVKITNLTNLPRRLVGVSVQTPERKWGWARWEELCPVEMRGSSLVLIAVPTESSEMSDEFNFEKNLGGKPIPPHETVSGWLGWECPKGNECSSDSLRVTVLDASGAAASQVINKPPVVMTLEPAAIHPIRKFNLFEMRVRSVSSCRK